MRTTRLIASIVPVLCAMCYGEGSADNEQAEEESTENITYTILYNNTSLSDSIFADHGFSCLIEAGDHTCLFDAGNDPEKFMMNVRNMGVDCSRIEYVFISHIHNDHMGGLLDILEECDKPALCMPVSYPRQEGESFGEQADEEYRAILDGLRPFVSELVQHQDLACLGDSFYTTGVIEKQSYEQALIIPTSKGLTVITGCAHPGIVEIVRQARERMKQDVYFVMGGFHLVGTDSTQIVSIARELRALTRRIGPCHCTGNLAKRIFKEVFQEDYVEVGAGLKLQ